MTLQEAAALTREMVVELKTRGWCQEKSVDDEGRCCAAGAADIVTGLTVVNNGHSGYMLKSLGKRRNRDIVGALIDHLEMEIGTNLVGWNDTQPDQETVVNRLNEIATKWEAA